MCVYCVCFRTRATIEIGERPRITCRDTVVARRDTTDSYAHPKLSGSWRTARTCRSAGHCACSYEGSRPPPPALVHPGWRQVGEACTRPWKGGGNVLRIKISWSWRVGIISHGMLFRIRFLDSLWCLIVRSFRVYTNVSFSWWGLSWDSFWMKG